MEREWVAEESVVIAAPPERVYAAVADLRRMGEWSPECFAVRVRGGVVEPDATFIGFNRRGPYVWFTNGRVTAAEPGEVFAFRVSSFGVEVALWGYRMEGGPDRTRLTEYWQDLRRDARGSTLVSWLGRVLTGVPAADRAALNREGMRSTLAHIKAALET
jgi:uncharacterized protein YndB with AHSA1/START domain